MRDINLRKKIMHFKKTIKQPLFEKLDLIECLAKTVKLSPIKKNKGN